MTLETGLRLVTLLGMLIVVVTGVLILQTRDKGQIHATGNQKLLVVVAGGLAVVAAGLGLLI